MKILPFYASVLCCGCCLLAGNALVQSVQAGSSPLSHEGKWMVRARGVSVIPSEKSTISPIGGEASINQTIVPEVDISYFFTTNWAVELIAATTQHRVNAKGTTLGTVDVGDAWLLPPTVTLQYHVPLQGGVKPYIGAGLNYTIFYDENPGALQDVKYSNSLGLALQAGIDVPVAENIYFNVDVKKIWIQTDVSFNQGAVRADVDINPWLVGIGVGYRF
jgi:outer membrane protein